LLSSSFNNIVIALLFRKETLRLYEVVAALLLNETQWGNNEFSNDGQVAMVTRKSSWRQGRSREKEEGSHCSGSHSQNFKCYCCNEEGHMKSNWSKGKGDLRDEKPSIVGLTEGSHQGDGGDVFLATAESPGKFDWILDSDCLFHMSLVREHFDACQPCVVGVANMENGTQSRITRIGTVQICMFDGVVQTVTGV